MLYKSIVNMIIIIIILRRIYKLCIENKLILLYLAFNIIYFLKIELRLIIKIYTLITFIGYYYLADTFL